MKQKIPPTVPNIKNEYTQTEEIFFKMHWSYFNGKYKIMTCNRRGPDFNNNNFLGISSNLFGQLKNTNFYKKQMNLNNITALNRFNGSLNHNIRSHSLNNKIAVNNQIDLPIPKKSNNYNINKDNINKKDNEQKDNIDEKNVKTIKIINQNIIQKKKIENDYMKLNFTLNKEIKKEFLNNNELIKNNSSIPKPMIGNKKNKSKLKVNINNYPYKQYNKNKNGNVNVNVNNANNNQFLSTKYGFNKNKIKKENLKIKMSKSSSSFYN